MYKFQFLHNCDPRGISKEVYVFFKDTIGLYNYNLTVKKGYSTKTPEAYTEFKNNCWEAAVTHFYNTEGDTLIKPGSETPMVKLFQSTFPGSWKTMSYELEFYEL